MRFFNMVGFWSVFGLFLVGFFNKINRKMVGLVCISNTTNHQPTKITVL
tara:strand:+ start:182 stop:328 length:147 start_codon:yes stop_codon:yes gene_type:complete